MFYATHTAREDLKSKCRCEWLYANYFQGITTLKAHRSVQYFY